MVVHLGNGVPYQIDRAVKLGALCNLGDVVGGLESGRLVVHVLEEHRHLCGHGGRRVHHGAVLLRLKEGRGGSELYLHTDPFIAFFINLFLVFVHCLIVHLLIF